MKPASPERVYPGAHRQILRRYNVPWQSANALRSAKSAPPSTTEAITESENPGVAVVIGRHSKQAVLITLMRRTEGATLDDLTSATGWQKHSVRGAISGALKKRLGLLVSTSKEERGQVYRITGERR